MVRLSISLAILSLLNTQNEVWADASSNSPKHPLMSSARAFVSRVAKGGATENLILGADEAATESLEVSIPLSQSPSLHEGRDAPLMRDISMLSDILTDMVHQEDPRVHDLFDEFLEYGKQRYVHL